MKVKPWKDIDAWLWKPSDNGVCTSMLERLKLFITQWLSVFLRSQEPI